MHAQHEKISGPRDLSKTEIERIDTVKTLEAKFNRMIDGLRGNPAFDQCQVASVAVAGEDVFRRAVRAIGP
jgi:hypothetical protein